MLLRKSLSKIFNRLGGFVRYGEIIENTETFLKDFRKSEERVVFGISLLGELDRSEAGKDNTFIKKLANQVKRD